MTVRESEIIGLIRKEVKPALGCTEPIAVALAVAKAMENVPQAPPQTVVINNTKEEMVTLLYMGAVAEDSTVSLGKLGEIIGRGGTRDIPKKEFLQNITPAISNRLKDRRLIVLDGLTEEERERYSVNYKDGELLSANVYHKLLSMGEAEVINIFKKPLSFMQKPFFHHNVNSFFYAVI